MGMQFSATVVSELKHIYVKYDVKLIYTALQNNNDRKFDKCPYEYRLERFENMVHIFFTIKNVP